MNPRTIHFPSGLCKPWLLRLGIVCAVVLLAGCGKRGPLYLPDKGGSPATTGEQSVNPPPTPPGKQ